MFAKSLAADYAAAGIRSNAVCPGFVHTPMTQWRLDVPELREQVEARIPTGRVAEPDDIADAIAVLASGRLGYMTGAALVVDGVDGPVSELSERTIDTAFWKRGPSVSEGRR